MDNILTIPIFICVLGLFFYWASFRYKTNNCLMAFLVVCYFLVLGGDVLTLSMIFIGTYSIGFWLNYFLAKQEDFGPLNLVSGFVALYIPVFFISVISSYPGILGRLPVSLKASLLDTKLLSVLIIIIALVCFVSLIVKKVEPLKARVHDTLAQFEDANALTFIPLLFVVSITSYVAMPTIGYDDLAIHSYIQNQVVAGKFPIFDVSVNVWSYAQWVSNVYYGLAGIYSNVEGRSVLNLFMALSIVTMLIKLFRRHFSTNISLLFVVFASSTPLFILSLTNSQSELISTFLLVSILYCYINYNQNTLVKALLIFAFSVAIKPSNAIVFGLPFVMFLAKEYELHKLTLFKSVRFYFSLLVSLFIFSSVYIFAFVKTGNPVYPLFNGIFHAPGFPNVNFFNSVYSGNFNVNAFLGLIFNTSKYMESNDGVAGFQLLLLPLVLLVSPFLYKRANKEVLFLYAIIISAIGMFYSQQYARYVGPSIFVATVVSCLLLSKIQTLSKKVLISILQFLSLPIFLT
ncbi:hypothetical protein [Enterovibrio coralii]|nr:hypothetical protein [Enterovibrio coralii]